MERRRTTGRKYVGRLGSVMTLGSFSALVAMMCGSDGGPLGWAVVIATLLVGAVLFVAFGV
jgi:hypothetical protein